MPRTVAAYGVLVVLLLSINVPRSHELWHHPPAAVAVVVVAVAFQAAIVLGRQRWAWWIAVVGGCIFILEPAWRSISLVAYLSNLAQLALLLSPGMRGWVRLRRPPGLARDQRTFGRDGS